MTNKRFLAAFLMLLLCTLGIGVGIHWQKQASVRLSEEAIEALREEYPVYPLAYPPLVDGGFPDLDELIEVADTFIYGEIVGDIKLHYQCVYGETPGEDTYYVNSYEYSLQIIEDTEGIFQQGDVVGIHDNIMFYDYKPQFQDGMKIVFGTIYSEEQPDRVGCMLVGTYYVTDDGYVLAVFPEEPKTMGLHGTYSGVKVEYLLKRLKKK